MRRLWRSLVEGLCRRVDERVGTPSHAQPAPHTCGRVECQACSSDRNAYPLQFVLMAFSGADDGESAGCQLRQGLGLPDEREVLG